jgi:hypothetical protein
MDDRFVLILVSLNPDCSDLSGFVFPDKGYVEARHYKPNDDIRCGFYGTLWGKTPEPNWLNLDPDAEWKVVRTGNNSEILYLDGSYNFVKFRRGHVVFSGDKHLCGRYIVENAPEDMDLTEVVAVNHYSVAKKQSLFAAGVESQAETVNADSHAINVGSKGTSKTSGFMSHAVALGHKGEAVASGNETVALAVARAVSKGADGCAICIKDAGHVVAGRRGIGIGLGEDCVGSGGEGSVLILASRQGRRLRFAIGYVGEGLEPGVTYRLNRAGYFEEVKSPAVV